MLTMILRLANALECKVRDLMRIRHRAAGFVS
jgi:DNA-binding Xre family transcriptional regulator